MATIDLGKISFTQKGTYDATVSYAPRDVVQFTDDSETSSYVKITSTATGQTPSTNGTINSTHWAMFAKGASIASNYQSSAWSSGTAYQKGAVVQFTDSGTLSTYLAVADSTGQQPSTAGTINSSFWAFLAKGTASIAISWQSVKTANFTASASEAYPVNTSGGAITATLPTSPSVGDRIIFRDYARTFNTNSLTLAIGSNNFQGDSALDPVFSTQGQTVEIVYIDATKGWLPTNVQGSDVFNEAKARYLVVAGGGSSGNDNGGGGGAGGFRGGTSDDKFTLASATTYTVTVGGGGGGTNNSYTTAGNSSISGSGLTTITGTGGGYGSHPQTSGQSGGSGGGAGQGGASAGSGNQGGFSPAEGNDGGTNQNGSTTSGGAGGGGAGQSGQNVTASTGTSSVGNGGDGKQSNITGADNYYAGGGGGGCNQSGESHVGSGGQGGGGTGGTQPNQGQAGTANTGGGAGGSGQNYAGSQNANGGSGVVIVRMASSLYSSSTGSPTITDVGGDKVLKFTGSGSFTTTSF